MAEAVRILTVCNGGNCRSPVLAEIFKGTHGIDALNMGTFWASLETQKLLCGWADWICPVEPYEAQLPIEDTKRWKRSFIWDPTIGYRVKIAKVGVDIWGHEKYADLKEVCRVAALDILDRIERGVA